MKQISVFGLGRVGLVTAVCLAKKGYSVVGIDPNTQILDLVRKGEAPFHEPLLSEYLSEVVRGGLLRVSSDPSSNSTSQMAYITVGTPSKRDGSLDLSSVRTAANTIAKTLPGDAFPQLIVIKSTVPPGTARSVVKPPLQKIAGKKKRFRLFSNPEFLREGKAIQDTERPDRIIVGSDNPNATDELTTFYTEFYSPNPPPIIRTTYENAELIKLAANAFLATKISFINSLANVAQRIPAADIQTVANAIGLDPRVGRQHLNAGLGWGGSCFPKDLPALINFSKKVHSNPVLLNAAMDINRKQWRVAIQSAEEATGSLRGKNVAILGLAFKPDTDDMREAVSIPLVRTLIGKGARVCAYDPAAIDNARRIFGKSIKYAKTPLECLTRADCCILVTEWDQFKTITPNTFRETMRRPIVIDGRRAYNPKDFIGAGITFHAVGLGPIMPPHPKHPTEG